MTRTITTPALPNTTFRSHQVSQVLLRQFTKDSKLRVFEKNGLTRLDIPRNVGYIQLNRMLYEQTEQRWGRVEDSFGQLLASHVLESEQIFVSPASMTVIKNLMALHYVRSKSFQELFIQNEKKVFDELMTELSGKGANEADVRTQWESDLETLRSNATVDLIRKVNTHVNNCNLEIVQAPDAYGFILGDNPVVNLTFDGKIGPLQGVGIAGSDAVFLPLTPKFVASLTQKNQPKSHYKTSAKSVSKLNKMTKKQCINEFYALPI